MKKYYILILSLITVASTQAQQVFNQYMFDPTPINPAYAVKENGSIQLVGHRQWAGIRNAPTSFFFNGSMNLESIKSTAGVILATDKYGIKNQTNVDLFFAKGVNLSEKVTLSVAINGGLAFYNADYASLDNTDPMFAENVRETKGNVGASLMLFGEDFYVGFSVPRITELTTKKSAINLLNNQYYFVGAYQFELGNNLSLKPAMAYNFSKGVPSIADFSTSLYINKTYGIGLNYRTNNEMAGILSFAYNAFQVGYSYQFYTGSTLGNIGGGSHEVGLRYKFGR